MMASILGLNALCMSFGFDPVFLLVTTVKDMPLLLPYMSMGELHLIEKLAIF